MVSEKEITVEVKGDYDRLHNDLLDKGFNVIKSYTLNDVYLVKDNIKIDLNEMNKILESCIIIRDVVGIEKKIVHKSKMINALGEIEEQYKTECIIQDINQGINFFEKINYKELIRINDECIVYNNDVIEITVQLVNEKYIFIEMEDSSDSCAHVFKNIHEMIETLSKYRIDYVEGNYFVKKAEKVLYDQYRVCLS